MPTSKRNEGTVWIVDDDSSVRSSLAYLLRSVGLTCWQFATGLEFLDRCKKTSPDCALLDIRLPDISGLRIQKRLIQQRIRVPLIMITGYADVAMAVTAMRRGAVDFLEKPVDDQTLVDAVQRALRQSSAGREEHVRRRIAQERFDQLTPREREVLYHVVMGYSNKETAAHLGISVKTVEDHRAHVMAKMEATNLPSLVRMALEGRLVE